MMQKGLNGWNRGGKNRTKKFMNQVVPDERRNISFPKDGMILRQTMRDLPRVKEPQHKTDRHNFDHCWFTKNEVAAFVPSKTEVGFKYQIPDALVKRFVRFHLVDQVKGESSSWNSENVKKAFLSGTVEKVEGSKATIHLKGYTKCTAEPTGEKNPFHGMVMDKQLGIELKIVGRLTYDSSTKSFEKFDMLGIGKRWGTTTYSFRHKDQYPSAIGFDFELVSNKPENRIRPKFLFSGYFE